MLNFLKTTEVFTVAMDRPDGIYYPGESIEVTIDVLPAKSLEFRSATVRLVGVEEYRYRSTEYHDHKYRDMYYWETNEFYDHEEKFLDATVLPKDVAQHYVLQVAIPANAFPSFDGDILKVSWKVVVDFDRRLALDLCSEVDLQLRLRPGDHELLVGNPGESSDPEDADLSFEFSGLTTHAGEPLTGRLCVDPHKNFDAQVRVDLQWKIHVPRADGNESEDCLTIKLAGQTHFVAGQPQSFDFQVPLPEDAVPTVDTPNGSIEWVLIGVLDRRLRSDTTIEQGMLIFPPR